jgi:hypothetical protein
MQYHVEHDRHTMCSCLACHDQSIHCSNDSTNKACKLTTTGPGWPAAACAGGGGAARHHRRARGPGVHPGLAGLACAPCIRPAAPADDRRVRTARGGQGQSLPWILLMPFVCRSTVSCCNKDVCSSAGAKSKRVHLRFAARGGGEGALSQAASRAASAMLRLLQQHKAQLPGKAFALHSAGGAPLSASPGTPPPSPGPMAAAALLGVLKGGLLVRCNRRICCPRAEAPF